MNVKSNINLIYPENEYDFLQNSFYRDLKEVERHLEMFMRSDVMLIEDEFFIINSIGQKTLLLDQLIQNLQLNLLKLGQFFDSEYLSFYESTLKTYSYINRSIIKFYELMDNILALKEDSYPSQVIIFELLVFIDSLKHPKLRFKLLESFNDTLNQFKFAILRNEVNWDGYLLSYLITNLETIIQDSQQIYISKPDVLFDRIYALIEICSDDESLRCFKILRSIISRKIKYILDGVAEADDYYFLKNLFTETSKIIDYLETELQYDELRISLINKILDLNDLPTGDAMYRASLKLYDEIESLRSHLREKWIKRYFREFLDILYRLFDFYSKLKDDTEDGSNAKFKVTRRINTIESKINFMQYYINK